jgi:hypothetical protein
MGKVNGGSKEAMAVSLVKFPLAVNSSTMQIALFSAATLAAMNKVCACIVDFTSTFSSKKRLITK